MKGRADADNGVSHIPVGDKVNLPDPIVDRLVEEGKVEYLTDTNPGYNRRDMQVEQTPVVAAVPTPKPKRKRRTKVEMDAARKVDESKGE